MSGFIVDPLLRVFCAARLYANRTSPVSYGRQFAPRPVRYPDLSS